MGEVRVSVRWRPEWYPGAGGSTEQGRLLPPVHRTQLLQSILRQNRVSWVGHPRRQHSTGSWLFHRFYPDSNSLGVYTVLYCTLVSMLYCTVLYCTVQYSTVLYCTDRTVIHHDVDPCTGLCQ